MGVDKNAKKINGKHIKHSPNNEIVSQIEQETTFLVKSSTPFISAYKRINKILDKFNSKATKSSARFKNGQYNNVKYVKIKGMGKTIEKALSLGLKFHDDLMYKTDILTGSVEVLDEFKVNSSTPDEDDGEGDDEDDEYKESVFKKRMVSYVEVRVWIKRD